MVFSSPVFLFFFLPVVLAGYFVAPRRARNGVLLAASLLFYAWGEAEYLALLLGSIAGNHAIALWVERERERASSRARLGVALAVVLNLAFLCVFKYLGWLWDSAVELCTELGLGVDWLGERPELHLPLGISFFTFQALSAVVDVLRGDVRVRRNPLDFALYVSCFPQLVAGPIVRYRDVAEQIQSRRETLDDFIAGVRRFVMGLAKKVLVADTLGAMVDEIFAVPSGGLGTSAAWLGVLGFGLQIYFDFSGYSDMAIGLGRIFGFRYRENFEHPYVSRSIREFWRRWHISLSTWFRDYVYIPLGGSRGNPLRTGLNLLTIFVLVGAWHGAAWNFVLFGVFHGGFMILERGAFGRLLDRCPLPLRHAYALLVVSLGWAIFRSQDLGQLGDFGRALAGAGGDAPPTHEAARFLAPERWIALLLGIPCSLPIVAWVSQRVASRGMPRLEAALQLAGALALAVLLVLSAATAAGSTLQPFIYFRF